MKDLNRNNYKEEVLPVKVLQFGGGNFLRGFVDWIIDEYNEKNNADLGVLVVKPTQRGNYNDWKNQDGLFHMLTRGIRDGQLVDESRLISCVSDIIHSYGEWEMYLESAKNPCIRYIISNTTESGIRTSKEDQYSDAPPSEFPAKLCIWLHKRFQFFKGSKESACVIIPTELLEDNGVLLKNALLQYADWWDLEEDFKNWIATENIFCNTLVDRIIPGVSNDAMAEVWEELECKDTEVTQGEPYHFWAIEAPKSVREELPLDKIGLNVIYTDDLTPYREIKVRILNGAHTAMVPVSYLYGLETVKETVEHEVLGKFVHQVIYGEIIPTLDLDDATLQKFASDVLDRFKNPFIKHLLISISLNSISKVKTRLLPSILEYQNRNGNLPEGLTTSFAATIAFYKGENNGTNIPLNDDPQVLAFFKQIWADFEAGNIDLQKLISEILRNQSLWNQDLNVVPGLNTTLETKLSILLKEGVGNLLK